MNTKPTTGWRWIGFMCGELLVLGGKGTRAVAAALCFACLAVWADEPATSPPPATVQAPDTNSQLILQAIGQLQGQLRSNGVAIEQNQELVKAVAGRNEASLSNGLERIERNFLAQQEDLSARSAREMEAIQDSNRSTLRVAVAIASIAFVAMLVSGYFQWRAARLWVAIPNALSSGRASRLATVTAHGTSGAGLAGAKSLEDSSLRFLGAVEQLDRRVERLEQSSKPALGGSAPEYVSNKQTSPGELQLASLMTQGQLKLKENDPEGALRFFDEALSLRTNYPEALVRKGTALERLNKADEALDCYERAIATDPSMTSAYLHKGSLYNRLERLKEALDCYEQALQSQESRPR